jgi:hypothetical protein
MVLGWFALLVWLFRRLRMRHAKLYERLGSPVMIWNTSMKTGWGLLRFIFSSQWRELDDAAIGFVVRFMRVYLIVYLALFIALISLSGPHRATR